METASKKHPNYMAVWVALALLTAIEVGIAMVHMFPKNVLILLLVGLAIWKALLVAMYYMHLKFGRLRLIILAAVPLPLAFIFVLAVLTEYVW
jgi:cytochrome c oxidase subunit 4